MSETIYCLKCRNKTGTKDETKVQSKNGRTMLRGACTACGTKKSKIVK